MKPLMSSAALLLISTVGCAPVKAVKVEKIIAENMLYTVAVVNLAQDHLELHWINPSTKTAYKTFEQLAEHLRKKGQRVVFATNSGIYAEGPTPLGLHIENGKTLVGVNNARYGGNFALLPNGVFWIKGRGAGVTETQTYKRLDLHPTFASQSGPLLVQNGKLHPAFNKSGSSFKLRSGVGVCQDGQVRFVISAGPVNFYTFAVFFRDTLKCPNALYLDGSISAYATTDTNTQLSDFAGIWAIIDK